MKSWQVVVMAAALPVVLPAVIGCRTDPNIMLLERENRMLEDQIYRLRAQLADCREVMQADSMIVAPGPSRAARDGAGPMIDVATPPAIAQPAPTPKTSPGPAAGPSVPSLEKSSVFVPGEPDATIETPDAAKPGTPSDALDNRRAPAEGAPAETPSGEQLEEAPKFRPTGANFNSGALTGAAGGEQVARIALSPAMCGGYDADGKPGDEGISLLLQPQNTQGRPIAAPGEVSVVLLDPALVGESARVARWDFSAAETAGRFHSDAPTAGIHLQTRWPAAPPLHEKLHLFVRYTTADGRRLEADRPIKVALPGAPAPDWVPAEPQPSEWEAGSPPKVRVSGAPSSRAAARPTPPAVERPSWSPDRP